MQAGRSRLTRPSLPIWTLLGLSLILLAVMLSIAPIHLAQTRETAIIVDTFEDELNDGGSDCSLREAIQAANTDSPVDGCPAGEGDDAILLPAGRYLLTLSGADEDLNYTGDLDIITGTMILMGPGPERTVIDGNRSDRVLHIHAGAEVRISGLQIANGDTGVAEPTGHSKVPVSTRDTVQAERIVPTPVPQIRWAGGGIHNAGSLALDHSQVIGNRTGDGSDHQVDGAHGGGIYNSGVLTLNYVSIQDNATGTGGGDSLWGGYGGNGGFGGGVYNCGSLTLSASIVHGNSTGDGGRGGEGGSGGFGGGIYNSSVLQVRDSTVEDNAAGNGGGGWWLGGRGGLGGGLYSSNTLTLSNSLIISNSCGWGGGAPAGYGARGGDGGGLYIAGAGTVISSLVAGNLTGLGGGGDYGSGGGHGGGIYNAGTLALSISSIQDNTTGDGGFSGWGPYLNSGGAGGGIYNDGTLVLSKSTISGNTTGGGGLDLDSQGSGGGSGGGIFNRSALTVTDSTVSGNTTGDGSQGERGNSGSGGGISNFGSLTLYNSTLSANTAGSLVIDGIGGGIYNYGTLIAGNTILAGNLDASGPQDCYQDSVEIQSQGYNLVEVAGSCTFATTGDVTGIQPRLGPLGDYGGETLTHALLPGSPATDQGSCRGSSTDQRSFPRPMDVPHIADADDGCDIGAFEVQAGLYIYLPLTTRHVQD